MHAGLTIALHQSPFPCERMRNDLVQIVIGRHPAKRLLDERRVGNDLAGVREFPVRVKCATLAWHAMTSALDGGGPATTE